MVIDDLNVVCVAIPPSEADPPLIVDPDAVLALAISLERFKPITGRRPKIVKGACIVDLHELTVRSFRDFVRNALDEAASPSGLCRRVPKRFDHSGDANVLR